MERRDDLLQLASNCELRNAIEPTLGTYCHQFRNRLNSIKLGIYLAKRQAASDLQLTWESLDRSYRAIEAQLDRVQAVCRNADTIRLAIHLDLIFEDRFLAWNQTLQQGGAQLVLKPPVDRCPTSVDVGRIGLALDHLAHWRSIARSGMRTVHVHWDRDATSTRVRWLEHFGSSVATDQQTTEPWQTWTLPLLARVMADHHGTVSQDAGKGWELTLSWPT